MVVSVLLVAACGSAESGSGEVLPSTTDIARSTGLQIPSKIVDGLLVVDYSSLEETRSMMATLATVGAGEPVGMFVTANDDGAIGQFFAYSDGETEVAVPMGELSGATDTFDLGGVATGSYELCSELVGGSHDGVHHLHDAVETASSERVRGDYRPGWRAAGTGSLYEP